MHGFVIAAMAGFYTFLKYAKAREDVAMKVLHLDSGREMRGGQWQVLRLHEALLAAGHESLCSRARVARF